MVFGDLNDPGSPIQEKLGKSQPLLASEGTEAKVFYLSPENTFKQIEQRVIENPKMMR